MLVRNTRAYRQSMKLVALAHDVAKQLPKGHAHLADQMKRASSSVVLNLAGSARASQRERRRFFVIARGSAFEVVAVLDICRVLEIVDDEVWHRGVELGNAAAALLAAFK